MTLSIHNKKSKSIKNPSKTKFNTNLISVNFHIWAKCNYSCRFCFAKFKDYKEILTKEEAFKIIDKLYYFGVHKINFAGGEPTLCPYLDELLKYSKKLGLTTSIISNGSGITKKFIINNHNFINWLGLSIDTGIESIQFALGRGNGKHVSKIIEKVKFIKKFPINLKINTVVTALNYQENMAKLLDILKPDRWKVFQVLPIENENREFISDLLISRKQFNYFIQRHKKYNPIIENNDLMINSYVMIDPKGRFFQNSNNYYKLSQPILDVGIRTAFEEICWNYSKFIERKGIYGW